MTTTTPTRSSSKATTGRTETAAGERAGEDRLVELQQQITDGVAALVDSRAWRAMLDTAARFHRYSLNNLILIAVQAPGATRVAGFRTWQSLGRQVRRGERGIPILAPCTYRTKGADNAEQAGGTPGTTTPGTDSGGGAEATPVTAGRQLRGFRRAYVFDITQTDGEPLPDVAPALLTGEAPAGLWEALAAQVTDSGYALERGDCGGANGYTDPARRTVRVRGDVEDAQAVKTLAHELGHLQCGHVTDLPTYATCRGRCEVEAESVAYIVTAARGLDTGGYTFPYVATWAGGNPTTVRQAADTVTTAARIILARLDDTRPGTDSQPAAADRAADST